MKAHLRALAFLELHYAKNHLRAIRREPQRLAIWLPTLLAFFAISAFRIDRGGGIAGARHAPAGGVSGAIASSALGFLFVALASIAAALALGGRTAVFRASAEAVLFSNVGMPPLLVAIWLQARKLASSLRILTGAIYVFVFMTPSHTSAAIAVRGLFLALLSFAIPTCIQLPAFLLRRTPLADPLRGIMWGVAALATGASAAVLLGGVAARKWLAAAHVDPGPFVRALVSGDLAAAGLIAAIIVVLCASIVVLGRDAMPDFYLATTQSVVERSARRHSASARAYADRRSRWSMPDGPFAYVWKDWIAFRRARGKFRLWLATLSFWTVVGTLTALAGSAQALGILALTCLMFLVGVAPVTAGQDLANDLSKPLFWLSHGSVVRRIAAITFGRAARTGLAFGVAPLSAAIFDGNVVLALTSLPLAVVFAWTLQAMGTALFAYFPADLDQRGPIVYVRLVLGVILLVPVPVVASFGFTFFGTLGGIACAFAVAAAEGALALGIASERFERRGGASYGRLGAVGS